MRDASPDTLLLGALSLDRYLPDGPILPGGGALNVAWHWRSLGMPFRLVTRIGDVDAPMFLDMLDRHSIDYGSPEAIIREGPSASIDIEVLPDREIHMDHYLPGVCEDLRFTDDERRMLAGASRLHGILVEGVIAELGRLGEAGLLADVEVVGDFLGFRHYTPERFADTMRWIDLAIVGWPGTPEDAGIAALRRVVQDLDKRLIVTFGSRGVLVLDVPAGLDRFVAVQPVPVTGTTVGCGDAFIAYLLAAWWATGDLAQAVERGKVGGALPTAWFGPLPDEAYGPLLQTDQRGRDPRRRSTGRRGR